MRLPPHVVRRRQGLYLRLRLPPDLARASGRTHVVRSLGTADPAQARSRAAAASAALHGGWDRVREELGRLGGVPVRDLTAAELRAALASPDVNEDLARLSPDDSAALAQRVRDLLASAGREVAAGRDERDRLEAAAAFAADARRLGLVDGLREAIASGAGERKPKAHPEAGVPWSSLVERFFASRPSLSPSTRVSYAQAFRECKDVVGDKYLSDLTARDVAKYSEFLEAKSSNRGSAGILNRKTIVRLTGHVRTFTAWAKSSGLIAVDPGADIEVRKQTRQEQRDSEEGSKRAFTHKEMERLFDSPLFVGCQSRHYRSRPGHDVYRDAAWWFLVVAHLTGARCEELADAPSVLVDLDGVTCLDLRHARKTNSAPRLVPIISDLTKLGFVAFADKQRLAGRKLFEGPGASADWSKWCNRYIDKILGVDSTVSFHSFRHSFRQSCSAAHFGDYLCDKILGHRSKKDRSEGSSYGRDLSPDEARLVVEKLKGPVPLIHLINLPARPRFPPPGLPGGVA